MDGLPLVALRGRCYHARMGNANPAREQEADRIEAILKAAGRVRTPTHKLRRFAVAWSEGERRATHLAKISGITEPTATAWKSRVLLADSGLNEKLPAPSAPGEAQAPAPGPAIVKRDRLEEMLSQALETALADGRLSDFSSLSEKMSKLQGWNAPDRVQTESVQVVLELTGGLDKVDALLVEQFRRMLDAGTLPPELAKLQPAPQPPQFARAKNNAAPDAEASGAVDALPVGD